MSSTPALAVTDQRFMQAALNFGRRWQGQTAPNPAVGCLVVRDHVIIGQGATFRGGRPHAETQALQQAGQGAQGATLYVTLEPCSHFGVTPPCADAIIRAGIVRVVCALRDPDQRVAGRGFEMLRAAGLEVVTEIGHAQAYRDHIGHILRVTKNRPLVTLKLAQTQDGFAAGDRHDRRLMITGQHANGFVHMLRAQHDGIMVGIGTVRADDPLLTVRLEGMEHRPLRIVLDPHLSLSDRSRLVATASQCPTLVFCAGGADAKTMRHLISLGVDVAEVAQGRDGGLDLAEVLRQLAGRGITRLFSEGGPSVAQSLLRAGLADDVLILTGPKALAHEGVPALGAAGRSILADPLRYTSGPAQWLGDDRLEHYWSVDVYGSD